MLYSIVFIAQNITEIGRFKVLLFKITKKDEFGLEKPALLITL